MHRVLPIAAVGLAFLCLMCGCASPDAALAAVWPEYRGSIYLSEHGRIAPEPLGEVARMPAEVGVGPFGRTALVHYGDGSVRAHDVIAWSEVEGARAVMRTVEIDGIAPGLDLFLRVPARDPHGRRLVVELNGGLLEPAFGTDESWVPLARDEATFIRVVLPRQSE